MVGENESLFDLDLYRKEPGKPISELDKALNRLSDLEDRLLRNLESRVSRGERLTAADHKLIEDLQQKVMDRKEAGRPETFVATAKQVAEHFGRTVRTIRNWAGRDMPQETDGYDLLKVEQWALKEGVIKTPITQGLDQERGAETAAADDDTPDRAYYEREIKRLDAELKTIKLQKETGTLIAREEVEKGWYNRAFVLKRDLLNMARRLSLKGANKEAPELYEIIRQDTIDILGKYSSGHVDINTIEVQQPPETQEADANA